MINTTKDIEKIVSMAHAIRELRCTNSLIPTFDDFVAAVKMYDGAIFESTHPNTIYRQTY